MNDPGTSAAWADSLPPENIVDIHPESSKPTNNASANAVDAGAVFRAFIAPMAVFLLATSLETSWRAAYPLVYTVKLLLVGAVIWHFRAHYREVFAPGPRGLGLAVGAGVAGIAIWLGLLQLDEATGFSATYLSWLPAGDRTGFDPFTEIHATWAIYLFLVARFCGLVLMVPFIEEIFWRGFLLRFLTNERFETVAWGVCGARAFLLVCLVFALTHTRTEFLAAFTWCALANAVYCRTGNLLACMVTHAVTNLLLGGYVLATASYSLW